MQPVDTCTDISCLYSVLVCVGKFLYVSLCHASSNTYIHHRYAHWYQYGTCYRISSNMGKIDSIDHDNVSNWRGYYDRVMYVGVWCAIIHVIRVLRHVCCVRHGIWMWIAFGTGQWQNVRVQICNHVIHAAYAWYNTISCLCWPTHEICVFFQHVLASHTLPPITSENMNYNFITRNEIKSFAFVLQMSRDPDTKWSNLSGLLALICFGGMGITRYDVARWKWRDRCETRSDLLQ